MILQRLKQETQPFHDVIERTIVLPTELPAYDALLGQFLGIYIPLENGLGKVDGLAGSGIELAARCKAPLLRADLRARGWSESQIAALPLCADVPPLADPPQALGCLYVLEGATLGGQYISKQIARDLKITTANGGRFFASYGANVGAMWQSFGACVTRYCDSPLVEDRVVESALATFAAFGRWFGSRRGAARESS